MEPCPADRMKRSRSGQEGLAGLKRWNLVHRTYAMAAAPIGSPGCPEFAFCTASADRKRIVSMHVRSSWDPSINRLQIRECIPAYAVRIRRPRPHGWLAKLRHRE